MNVMKSFTVLMPVHQRENAVKQFEKSIISVFKNSLLPKQTLILIDGPINKHLNKIIFFYKNKFNYQIIHSKKKIGLVKILNKGINKTKSQWIIRADSDDINSYDRFEKLMNIKNEKFDLIGSHIIEVDYETNKLLKKKVPINNNQIVKFLKFRNPFNHMSVAFKKKIAQDCGGYPDIPMKEDYAFWATMISNGAKVKNLNSYLVTVTAGAAMYKRRSGFEHINSEINLQKHLVKSGFNNTIFSIIIGLVRIIFSILPYFIKSFFYKNFLRRNNK